MKYLFLDTNILIHYQCFEDIPWNSVLETADDITVVICETVVAEIDKHKDGQKIRIKDRAKKVSSRIGELLLDEKVGKLPVLFCPFVKPTPEEERIYELSVCDNRIILAALHSDFNLKDIVVVSADNNLLIKAKSTGLGFYKMKEEYLVKAELTDEEKELKKTKEELAKWTSRMSNPNVFFHNTEGETIIFPLVKLPDLDSEVAKRVEDEAKQYPEKIILKQEESMCITSDGSCQKLSSLFHPTIEQIQTYNAMRKDYLRDYEKKVTLEVKKEFANASFKNLKFYLSNTGTAPTGNMYVSLHFPQGTKLYTESYSQTSQDYKMPVTPQYIRHFANYINSIYQDNRISFIEEEKSIKKYNFNYQESELIHGLERKLDTDLMIDTRYVQDIEIMWVINDSSLPEPKSGTLRIIVQEQ